MFTPVEAAHIITACENRLLTSKIFDHPFTVEEIRGGALAQHLTMDDYLAPLEVIGFFFQFLTLSIIFPLILFS